MKYEQDQNASAEILRLVIQKMSVHPAAFTPQNYAVWYEFVTGINGSLNHTLNKLLDTGFKLDDDTIEKLYLKYVSECNTDIERALREEIRKLLEEVAGATEKTDKQADQFGNSLQKYGESLKQKLDATTLVTLISDMSGDTNKMRGSMQNLQSELEISKQQVEKLQQDLQSARGEALTDPLTSLLNRRGFESGANEILADQINPSKGSCMLMVDIDHFKNINDTYGHLFGDKVICGIAEILKSKVRGQDSVARLGGEEFAVLLADTDTSGARIVAENIRQSVERCKIHRHDSQEVVEGISISIGVAAFTKGGSLINLLDQADKALYDSKKQGRNRTTVYS